MALLRKSFIRSAQIFLQFYDLAKRALRCSNENQTRRSIRNVHKLAEIVFHFSFLALVIGPNYWNHSLLV